MLRWGLRSLLAALPLLGLGYLTDAYAGFEVLRFLGFGLLLAGLVLLFINYLRTPEPGGPSGP